MLSAVKANIKWYTKSELIVEKISKAIKIFFYLRQVRHYKRIKSELFYFTEQDIIIIPGGILNPSNSYLMACRFYGLKFYTYDSGINGQVIFARSSVAAHLEEINEQKFDEITPCKVQVLLSSAEHSISERMNSSDKFKYQKVERGGTEYLKYLKPNLTNILIPLSCPWDAASLLRRDIFRSEINLIVKVLEQYKNSNILVRVHPIERLPNNSRNDDLAKFFKNDKRVKIITAETNVNTYDFLDYVDLVICRNTSIGAEALICGKKVFSTSISYWNDTIGLQPTSLDLETIKMRYALAQVHNWNFPPVNLNNVSYYSIDTDGFDEFTDMVLSYKTQTEVKMNNII